MSTHQTKAPKPGKSIFSRSNMKFSHEAHDAAVEKVYDAFFPEGYEIQDMTHTKADKQDGIDYFVQTDAGGKFKKPVAIGIQERFRRAKFAHYRDLTISSHDYYADREGEFYKGHAAYQVFGYYDQKTGTLGECVVVNLSRVLMCMATGQIEFEEKINRAQGRGFLVLSFDALKDADCIDFHYVPE